MGDYLDLIFKSYGLHHIGIKICSYLDPQSVLNCHLASTQWNQFFNENKFLWQMQITKLKSGIMKNTFTIQHRRGLNTIDFRGDVLFISKFLEWKNTFDEIQNQNIDEIKTFVQHMVNYLNIDWNNKIEEVKKLHNFETPYCPIYYAISIGNEGFINILKTLPSFRYVIKESLDKVWIARQWFFFYEFFHKSSTYGLLKDGQTELIQLLLYYANTPDSVKMFLKEVGHNLDLNKRFTQSDGFTVLHIACYNGNVEIVKVLLQIEEGSLNVNERDNHGRIPLHLACLKGRTEIVKLLIDIGERLNINEKDSKGSTPLHIACKIGHTKIVRLLLEEGGERLYINERDKNGNTPLHIACCHGYTEIVNLLLHNGGKNLKTSTKGSTPLQYACHEGHTQIVKLLLEKEGKSLNINERDTDGYTLLHYACLNGHTEIVKILCKHEDIDINAASHRGETPLKIARESRYKAIVKILRTN